MMRTEEMKKLEGVGPDDILEETCRCFGSNAVEFCGRPVQPKSAIGDEEWRATV